MRQINSFCFFFFFQAEDGIRDLYVTGVQTCALPIWAQVWADTIRACADAVPGIDVEVLPSDFKGGERDIATVLDAAPTVFAHNLERSEERRVGKECRSRWSP